MSFLHSKCEKEISDLKQKIQKTESEMNKLNDQLAEVKTKKESEIKKLKKELNNTKNKLEKESEEIKKIKEKESYNNILAWFLLFLYRYRLMDGRSLAARNSL